MRKTVVPKWFAIFLATLLALSPIGPAFAVVDYAQARAEFGGLGGTELFLGGRYIELGISNWGDFGTEGTKPDNFRGTRNATITDAEVAFAGLTASDFSPSDGSDSIGMSADFDGFGQGFDLPVDYYLPGTPEERFVVGYRIGESTYANSNSALESAKSMPTTVTNESNLASGVLQARIVSVWADTMEITQVVRFGVNDKYYRTDVTVRNISGTNWDSARYMRSFDPDNTQYRGGSFDTSNTVTRTIEEDGIAVVVAETFGDTDPMYRLTGSRFPFFFYSRDPAARASVFGFTNTDPYEEEAYDNPRAKGDSLLDDVGITLTWEAGPLAPGGSNSFWFISSLDERDYQDVIDELDPVRPSTDGRGGLPPKTKVPVDEVPGDEVPGDDPIRYSGAYVSGYPDGLFRPSDFITRAHIASILHRFGGLSDPTASSPGYPDVPAGHWAADAIRQIRGSGLLAPYADGTFRPNASITRASLAVILNTWLQLDPGESSPFADTEGHSAQSAIQAVAAAGLMSGYPDGSFRPNQQMTRAEAVVVFNRVIDRTTLALPDSPTYADVPLMHWAYADVERASMAFTD